MTKYNQNVIMSNEDKAFLKMALALKATKESDEPIQKDDDIEGEVG